MVTAIGLIPVLVKVDRLRIGQKVQEKVSPFFARLSGLSRPDIGPI
jgi:hypothetical protein